MTGAVGGEAVDPVAAVGDVHRAVRADGDRADRRQPVRVADLPHELAVRAEDLDGVRVLVGDVHRAVGPTAVACGKRRTPPVRLPITEEAEYGHGSAPGHGAAVAVAGSANSAASVAMTSRRIKGSQPEADRKSRYCFRRRSEARDLDHARVGHLAPDRVRDPVRAARRAPRHHADLRPVVEEHQLAAAGRLADPVRVVEDRRVAPREALDAPVLARLAHGRDDPVGAVQLAVLVAQRVDARRPVDVLRTVGDLAGEVERQPLQARLGEHGHVLAGAAGVRPCH